MGAANNVADVLQTYGGWGISAILMITVWTMARHITRLNTGRLNDQKKFNEEMLHIAENRIETDLKHAEAFKSLREVILKLIEKL